MHTKITKTEIIKIIKECDFLPVIEKHDWLKLVDTLDDNELQKVHEFFTDANQREEKFKLKLIFKGNLGKEYENKIKRVTDKFKKNSIKKEEAHLQKTSERPEDLLKKLDNL